MLLSILCVTRAELHSPPFLSEMLRVAERCAAELVVVADGRESLGRLASDVRPYARSRDVGGIVEKILPEAVSLTAGRYVLRLDDDERLSPALEEWVVRGEFARAPHWSLPWVHLWRPGWIVMDPPFGLRTAERLSIRSMTSRTGKHVHAKSAYGHGELAPAAIEHHKFLVKTKAEREAVAARYEAVRRGAGTGRFRAYSVPEDVYDHLTLAPFGDGTVREFEPGETVRVTI